MKTITEEKPFKEIEENLKGINSVYLIGCGTCATMCRTGGEPEVLRMKEKLEAIGKKVSGWMIIPTACDVDKIICIGAGSPENISAHQPDEYVELDGLVSLTKQLAHYLAL